MNAAMDITGKGALPNQVAKFMVATGMAAAAPVAAPAAPVAVPVAIPMAAPTAATIKSDAAPKDAKTAGKRIASGRHRHSPTATGHRLEVALPLTGAI